MKYWWYRLTFTLGRTVLWWWAGLDRPIVTFNRQRQEK